METLLFSGPLTDWLTSDPGSLILFICLLLLPFWAIAWLLWRRERRLLENQWALRQANYELQIEDCKARASAAESRANSLETELEETNDILRDVEMASVEQRVRLEQQRQSMLDQQEAFDHSRRALESQFENLANRLFEHKQQQFTALAQTRLEGLLSPFRQDLRELHRFVEKSRSDEDSQRNQLIGQLTQLRQQSQQLGADAASLTRALKGDNKVVGNWGEVVLQRILEQSGLTLGREFDIQVSAHDHETRRRQPDVIVHLPHQREVIIDAKVSLVSYERYVRAEQEAEKKAALKGFTDSIRSHIRQLGGKRYDLLPQTDSLDLVLMFLPVEPAYWLVLEHCPELIELAHERHVLLVSPSLLMTALRMVEALWLKRRQEDNVRMIADSAGRLHDQFVRYVESREDLAVHLQRALEAHELSNRRLTEGKGNLAARIAQLKALGANVTKELPTGFVKDT